MRVYWVREHVFLLRESPQRNEGLTSTYGTSSVQHRIAAWHPPPAWQKLLRADSWEKRSSCGVHRCAGGCGGRWSAVLLQHRDHPIANLALLVLSFLSRSKP